MLGEVNNSLVLSKEQGNLLLFIRAFVMALIKFIWCSEVYFKETYKSFRRSI